MIISDNEKISMIALAYSDWQQTQGFEENELFQALITLIDSGEIVALYDDNDGSVKYQAVSSLPG